MASVYSDDLRRKCFAAYQRGDGSIAVLAGGFLKVSPRPSPTMAEKILARGELLGHVTGVALVAAGVALMARLWQDPA
jgi:hypothetical protein